VKHLVAALAMAGLAAAAAAAPPAPAQRIVVLAPHLAELVYAAGAGERLVGAVAWTDYPPEAADLPRIGDAFRLDLEALAVLRPDLVLAWKGGNPDHMLEQLEQRGYRVVRLAPQRLDDVASHLLEIGRLTGTPEPARRAAERYRNGLDELRREHSGKRELRVFYQVSWRPLYTVGGSQLITEVMALCGGRNIFAELGELAPAVGMEAVIARDPEVILTSDVQQDELAEWRPWPGVTAVARGHLYSVNGDLLVRAAPRILQGIREICARLDDARG
jgi:iron complex transport system substrate-binding protein